MSAEADPIARLRPMRPADVAPLVELWVAAWQGTMPAIDFDARRPWIASLLADAGLTTLVAAAAEPLGFVTLDGAQLHQLCVAPAAQGCGIARLLLDAAKMREPGGLALDVNQANTRAVRFYEREGFRRAGPGINPASGLATFAMRWP